MHYTHIHKPGPFQLTPGQTYLMDDNHAGQYLMMGMTDHVWHSSKDNEMGGQIFTRPKNSIFDDNPDGYWLCTTRLLIVRCGGMGDLLMLTPSLAELQRRFPTLQITVATAPQNFDALTLPGIAVIPYPVPLEEAEKHDVIIPLEGLIENDNVHDGHTLWAHALGLIPTLDTPVPFSLQPIYNPDPELVLTMHRRFPRKLHLKHRIGIQIHASAVNRTYPVNQLAQVMELLIADQCDLYLFGNPADKKDGHHDQITSLPNLDEPPTFAESAALLSTMDACIVPDSSLCHIAGALNLPTVALYGPFHWRQRTVHSPSIHAIQGVAPCSPCHHHGWDGHKFPTGQPCHQTNYCHALDQITPDRIVAKLKQLLTAK